jgi:hypothetical protein
LFFLLSGSTWQHKVLIPGKSLLSPPLLPVVSLFRRYVEQIVASEIGHKKLLFSWQKWTLVSESQPHSSPSLGTATSSFEKFATLPDTTPFDPLDSPVYPVYLHNELGSHHNLINRSNGQRVRLLSFPSSLMRRQSLASTSVATACVVILEPPPIWTNWDLRHPWTEEWK